MRTRHKFALLFLIVSLISIIFMSLVPYQLHFTELNTSNKKVAAFYYGWYSNTTDYSQTNPYTIEDDEQWRHWNNPERGWYPPSNACSVNTPLYGWYDSADPFVIEQHLRQAEFAGIDAFVVSYWGGGFEFDNFKTILAVAKEIDSNVSLSLYFEIFMDKLPEKEENDAVDFMVNEFTRIYDLVNATENRNYTWIEEEKPVLFVYVSQSVSSPVWSKTIANMTQQGKEFFIMADRPGSDEEYNKNFQGSHQYDAYAPIRDGTYYEDFIKLKQNAKKFDQIFAAAVSPAYNDTVVRDGNEPFSRDNGEYYKNRWEDAISLNPDWITITSWNEWHEGTEIEPSLENGDLALNQTKQFIEEFKKGEYIILNKKSYMDYANLTFMGISLSLSIVIVVAFTQVTSLTNLKIPSKGILRHLKSIHVLPWIVLLIFLALSSNPQMIFTITTSGWIFITPILIVLQVLIPIERKVEEKGSDQQNN